MQNLRGIIHIPGDKSITHRALIFGAIADAGRTIFLRNCLQSYDCLATRDALAALGVSFSTESANTLVIHAVGIHGLQQPSDIIDVGNSGTTIRLLTGLLAAQRFSSSITGDLSIQRRPMHRVIAPLRLMGAKITAAREDNFAPLNIEGGQTLHAINYSLSVASAQVKSAITLADIYTTGTSTVTTPYTCRDHTEILLDNFSDDIVIPGDISAAAFFIVAATITHQSDIFLPDIGINPTRNAVLEVLQKMGANISLVNVKVVNGELRADIRVRGVNKLEPFTIDAEIIPRLIDEIPILCLAAACADGVSIIRGAGELRYKESDRIKQIVAGLQQLGINAKELVDGLTVEGGIIQGGMVSSGGDHRIAMMFAIARLVAKQEIIIQDMECVDTSFPNFFTLLRESTHV